MRAVFMLLLTACGRLNAAHVLTTHTFTTSWMGVRATVETSNFRNAVISLSGPHINRVGGAVLAGDIGITLDQDFESYLRARGVQLRDAAVSADKTEVRVTLRIGFFGTKTLVLLQAS